MASKDDDFDKEYDEKLNARREIDLEGDGITWYDPSYDERMGEAPFYEKPNAAADYDHWGKVAFYNPEEATALLLGKAPEIVTLESTKPLIQEFDFPKTYKKICTLIERAVIAKELRSVESLIKPTDLLDWARLNQLDIPKELIDAIEGDSICMKTEESTAKPLERDPLTRASNDKYADLDGDGITWIDKEYDEKLNKRREIDLLGDGITWLDPDYDEMLNVQFYDESHANADYGYWGKVALWSSAEAAALLLGKEPQIVTPDSIKPYIKYSGFPKKYMQMYTLIDRAVSAGELQSESNLIKPIDLLDWAGKHNISVPNELVGVISESITPEDEDVGKSDAQSSKQKRSEHDQNLQGVANHVGGELNERLGRRPTKAEVVGAMIKILDEEYPVDKNIFDLLVTNIPTRKGNNDDAFFNSILRRIRAEW